MSEVIEFRWLQYWQNSVSSRCFLEKSLSLVIFIQWGCHHQVGFFPGGSSGPLLCRWASWLSLRGTVYVFPAHLASARPTVLGSGDCWTEGQESVTCLCVRVRTERFLHTSASCFSVLFSVIIFSPNVVVWSSYKVTGAYQMKVLQTLQIQEPHLTCREGKTCSLMVFFKGNV